MRSLALALVLGLLPTAASALTVDDAIKQALTSAQGNVRERVAREQAAAANDTAWSVGSRMLVSLHLSEEFQRYASPFQVNFGAVLGAGSSIPPLTVRNQNTNTFVASFDQPLIGLLRMSHDYLSQKHNAKAILEGVSASDQQLVEAVRTGYLRYFEAVAAEGVGAASEVELAEQVRVAQSREKAGVITVADLLRVQVAMANAHQQKVQAHAQAQIARANLLDAIGSDANDEKLTLDQPTDLLELAAQPVPDRENAAQDAINRRPEVRQAQLAYDSAVANRRARIFAMLPDADLEGAYARIDGQAFAQKNSWYIGVKASWAIWEWGSGYFAQRAAQHQANAARLSLDDQKRQVTLEVKTAFANLDAATAAVEAARQAIDSANEAYRVTTKSVEAGTATTTDLLNAQSELTTARLNLERSRYEQAMSRVTLLRLTGN